MITDLASRDEYLDQKLRTAARVIWLALGDVEGNIMPLDPTQVWLERESDALRAMLFAGGQSEHRYRELRFYVLRLLGISQAYASSSRNVEQPAVVAAAVAPPIPEPEPEPEPQPEPVPDSQTQIRDWVLHGKGL